MPTTRALILAALIGLVPPAVRAEQYTLEPLAEAAPAGLADEVRSTLAERGYRVLKDGQPFLDVWLRKDAPARSEPGDPKGTVLFPFLSEGELLGAARYHEEGYDYRDQAIVPEVYTLRYGLQPVNGDHLGVSPFRDYALLVQAEEDRMPADLDEKELERQSAQAAGTNHPAVLMLVRPPAEVKAPAISRDEAKDLWGAVLPLSVKAGDASEPRTVPVQLVVVGAAAL